MPLPDTPHSLLEALLDHGDVAAWTRFVALYEPLIRRWATRHARGRSDAEDVVQAVIAAMIRALPEFRHNQRPGAFRAWLKAITVNQLRRRWREATNPPDTRNDLVDPRSDLSRMWDEEHDRHVLALLFERIRPDFEASTWEAFRLVVLDGQPPRAAATRLGITVNAVYIAKARVMKRLRQEGRGLIDLP